MRLPSASGLVVASAACAAALALAGAGGGFSPVSWNIGALVGAWIALLALLLHDGGRPGRWGTSLLGAALAVTAWTALSATWSDSRGASLEEAQRCLLYLVAVAAALAVGRRLELEAVAAGLVVAVDAVCVWNLATRWGQTVVGREAGPIGYANGLALLAALGAILAVGFALERRPVALAALLPVAPVLVLSRSNGAWAALAGGLVVLALARSPLSTKRVVACAAVVAVLFAVASVLLARGHERGVYWSAALHEVAARPVLGSGAGTYGEWFLRLRSQPYQTLDAHSLYLETLAELGPVGLAALAALLGFPLAAGLRARRRPLVPAATAGVVAYALGAGVDFDWELAGVTLPVLLLGAALAVAADGPRPRLGRPARAVAAAAVAVTGAVAALALAGNAPLAAAEDALASGRPRSAEADARRARFLPWSARPWLVLGEAREALGDRAGARAALERAVAEDPHDWNAWLRLAGVSDGEQRRRALARAALLNPLYFR